MIRWDEQGNQAAIPTVSYHTEVSVSAVWMSSWMTGVEGFQASWPKRTSTKLGVTATYISLLKREGKNHLDKYFFFVVEAGLLVVPCRSGRGEQEVFPRLRELSWDQVQLQFTVLWRAVRVSLSFTRVQEWGLSPVGLSVSPLWMVWIIYLLYALCRARKIVHSYLCLLDVFILGLIWIRLRNARAMEQLMSLFSGGRSTQVDGSGVFLSTVTKGMKLKEGLSFPETASRGRSSPDLFS